MLALFSASAQQKEIRVLLANHPYGDLLQAAIPEYEKATGVKVNVESLQSQLTTKLTTRICNKSSTVDVFMTRPLQEGKMFYKNGWYEPLTGYDFSDYPKNAMDVASFGSKAYIVPLVTEWEVLYCRMESAQESWHFRSYQFAELEAAAKKLHSGDIVGLRRGKGAAAVTQLSSYVYAMAEHISIKAKQFSTAKKLWRLYVFYGKGCWRIMGLAGVTNMSWENIMPLFQAGKIALWTDASVFYGQIVDPSKKSPSACRECRYCQLPSYGPAIHHLLLSLGG